MKHSRLATAVIGASGLTAALLGVPVASAHDQLVSTNPSAGSRLDHAPHVIALTFNEKPLDVGSEAVVENPDGSRQTSAPKPAGNGVSFPFSPKGNGQYAVTWRIVSSDGHPISGTFDFTVQDSAASSPTSGASAAAGSSASSSEDNTVLSPASSTPTSASSAAASASKTSQKVTDDSTPTALWIALGLAALGAVAGLLSLARRRNSRANNPDHE